MYPCIHTYIRTYVRTYVHTYIHPSIVLYACILKHITNYYIMWQHSPGVPCSWARTMCRRNRWWKLWKRWGILFVWKMRPGPFFDHEKCPARCLIEPYWLTVLFSLLFVYVFFHKAYAYIYHILSYIYRWTQCIVWMRDFPFPRWIPTGYPLLDPRPTQGAASYPLSATRCRPRICGLPKAFPRRLAPIGLGVWGLGGEQFAAWKWGSIAILAISIHMQNSHNAL